MSKTKLAVLGGSVAAGTSARLDVFHDCLQYGTATVNRVRDTQTWWSILERILSDWVEGGVEVINEGVAGDTAAKGLARVDPSIRAWSPGYVLVLLGPQDAVEGTEREAFEQSVESTALKIAAADARPVLLTPTPLSERMTAHGCSLEEARRRQERLSRLTEIVRRVAREKSVALVDLNRHVLQNRLIYDHLHEGWLPDGVAQSAMASFVAGKLLDLVGVQGFPKLTVCGHQKVYSDPEHPDTMHNAFTDLTYFQGEFFTVFRNGRTHGDLSGGDLGSEVILRSEDGANWVKDAVLQVDGLDNRDPKFLQADGKLMLCAPCIRFSSEPSRTHEVITYGFQRLGPGQWGEPFECASSFFWRPKKWRDQYVVADEDVPVRFLSSPDGRNWKVISTICTAASGANETDLWVEGNQLTAFSRADPADGHHYMLVSKFIESENRWETVSSGRIVEAPCVFENAGRLFVTGRTCAYPHEEFRVLGQEFSKVGRGEPDGDKGLAERYHHGLRTGIFVMDGTRARQVAELLSAGDSSYPGVVRYGDDYLISDYSMHEYYRPVENGDSWKTPSHIYVSRIRFGERA